MTERRSITLNLETSGNEHKILKDYLESNVSELLADKINNGVKIEKDGKVLVNKKDLNTFLNYACEEARKQAEKGARFACIDHATVFSWAIHYFEEDALIGKLYNRDGSEYVPLKPVYNGVKVTTPIAAPAPKPKPQMSMFDLMSPKVDETIEIETPTMVEPPIDNDETIDEILSIKPVAVSEPVQVTSSLEQDAMITPSPLQTDDNKFVDEDGVIHKNYIPPLLDEPAITPPTTISTTVSSSSIPPFTPSIISPPATTPTIAPLTNITPPATPSAVSADSSNEIIRWLHSLFGDKIKVVL